MTAGDRRLRRIYSALSVDQRASIALSTVREEQELDPLFFQTMPDSQLDEFGRLLRIVQRAQRPIGHRVIGLMTQMEPLQLRYALVMTLAAWGADRTDLVSRLLPLVSEPITESRHAELMLSARADYVPLDEAAAVAAEELGSDSSDVEGELQRLSESGAIRSRTREGNLEIESGSLHDWLGEPAPIQPGWAPTYDVVPDARWDEERWRLALLRDVGGNLAEGPLGRPDPLAGAPADGAEPGSAWDSVACQWAVALAADIHGAWVELLTLEITLASLRDELSEFDLLPPEMVEALAWVREALEQLPEDWRLGNLPELPRADPDAIASLRAEILGEPTDSRS